MNRFCSFIISKKFNCHLASLAVSDDEQSKGFMFKETFDMPIVFYYSDSGNNSFWMKNVKFPLDIIFCLNGKIVGIKAGKPFSTELINVDSLSDLVIEMPFGFCEKMKIFIGDVVNVEEIYI